MSGGQSRDRTGDTRIFSPVLYQLSYLPFLVFCGKLYPQTNSKNIIELRYIYVKIFIAPQRPDKYPYTGFFVYEKHTNDKFRFSGNALLRRRSIKLYLPIYPNVLRHSCGFKLTNDGHDTRSIQHYLDIGHRNIQNTVPYMQVLHSRFKGFWKG